MELLYQYNYGKGKVVSKAMLYVLLSLLFVGLGAFCFWRWDLSFMFTDWHGYVLLVPYFLITLGTIITMFQLFVKIGKLNSGVPAFSVGADCFVFYDKDGLPSVVRFADCEQVRFKRNYKFRGSPAMLTLIVKYRDKMRPEMSNKIEIELSELDRSQWEVDKQLKKVYQKYKAANAESES